MHKPLKVGDSIDGEHLDETALSGTRLEAFVEDGKIIVVEDKGNFNYKVLAITDLPKNKRG